MSHFKCCICLRRISSNAKKHRTGTGTFWPIIQSAIKTLHCKDISMQDFICSYCNITILSKKRGGQKIHLPLQSKPKRKGKKRAQTNAILSKPGNVDALQMNSQSNWNLRQNREECKTMNVDNSGPVISKGIEENSCMLFDEDCLQRSAQSTILKHLPAEEIIMGEKYKLTYFNVKALAEPIRMIFAVAGVEYEDVRIEKEQWPELKQNYDWGQLPVLEVGDKKLAQSNTIARYLGKEFKLAGADNWESAKIDELADVMVDFRAEWRKFFMEQDADKKAELKKNFLEVQVPKYFGKLDKIKEENGGKFLVGENVSWVDLLYAHSLELFEITVDVEILENYPNLKSLKQNVFDLPQIKAWVEKRPVTAF